MSASWAGRSVFVTGGNGFLGSHLVRLLVERGARVTCLVKREMPLSLFHLDGTADRVTCVRGDIVDFDLLREIFREHGVDAAFHLAAQPIVSEARTDPLGTLEPNVRGTYHLLEAARRWGKLHAVVVATSDKVYGEPEHLPHREGDRLGGLDVYDASKVCADVIARSFARLGLPVAAARCGNLYGPGDAQWSRIVPGTIKSLLAGERPIIRGDGKSLRDYFYVEDAADALLWLGHDLDRPDVRGAALNFGTGVPTATIDIVRALVRRSGTGLEPVVLNEAGGEISAQYLCCDRARLLLGWEHATKLLVGLDRAWAWYERVLA